MRVKGALVRGAAALGLAFSLTGSALANTASEPTASHYWPKWLPWVEGGGIWSTEKDRAEVNAFVPLWQSSVAMAFFQGTGKFFEDDIKEGNFDLGFRYMDSSGWNFGVWAGYDVRETQFNNTFGQVSFGLEALSENWDARINGYVSVTDPKASPGLARVFLSGSNILMTGGQEVGLSGLDGEIGYKIFGHREAGGGGLKDGPVYGGRSHEVRVFAGGFYFDDGDALEDISGPRARLEWRIDNVLDVLPGSRLTLEGEYQYDDVREDQWEGGFRLRVPFGPDDAETQRAALASLTPQERRMTESLVRDTDIVTNASKEENVFDTLTGVHFDRAVVVQGNGTLVNDTLASVGPDSLVIVTGGTSGATTVGSNRTLQGGGSTIQVTGRRTGTTVGFTAPGVRPLIENTGTSAVVTLDGNNVHLAGLAIQGGGGRNMSVNDNHGLLGGSGRSNIVIEQSAFANLGDRGIDFDNDNSNIRIMTSSFDNIGNDAIHFDDDNSNIRIMTSSFDNIDNDAIEFDDDNSNIRIAHLTIHDTGNEGIEFNNRNSDVVIANVSISMTGDQAIHFQNDNTRITFIDSVIDGTEEDGIDFEDGNRGILIQNVVINNAGDSSADHSIKFDDRNTDVTIAGVTINGATGDGLNIGSDNSNFRIENVVINNAARDGIDLGSNNTGFVIGGTTINGAGFDGLFVGGGGNEIAMSNTTFTGAFVDDAIDINAAGNTLSGTGNVFTGTVGGQFCEVTGGQTGAFSFTNGTTCP